MGSKEPKTYMQDMHCLCSNILTCSTETSSEHKSTSSGIGR